ncbi:MAG: hypothetical protein ACFHWX_09715 [Bacteroidota bacterium]
MIRLLTLFSIILLLIECEPSTKDPTVEAMAEVKDPIIVPASDFIYELPKGDVIAGARSLNTDWVFNNTAIVLNSRTNLMTTLDVPEGGEYNLFARGIGSGRSSFKVVVNDRISENVFGSDTVARLENGGRFIFNKGKNVIKISRIETGSAFDVLVFTKAESITDEDIKTYQLTEDVQLLKEYEIPRSGAVKFGDVDGDNQTDFLVLTRDYSAHVFDNTGKKLWSWESPEIYRRERSEFEAPGVLWDFDKNGKAEVVHWRQSDEKEWLTIANGITGEVIRQTEWPTKPLPHVYNNFRLAIGKLTDGDPNEILVFTDMGGTIRVDAYDSDLNHLWNHTEIRKKDNLGHYVYPVDLDKDGIDEVLVGSLLLDSDGKEIWNRFDFLYDNHDHADNYKFADINQDGRTDLVTANSETGVFMFDGMSGEIIWQQVAEHTQQIEVGDFLDGERIPQIVAGARTYGNRRAGEAYLWSQLYWYTSQGELLFKWPQKPINGNPDFVKGDWKGNGYDQLFWFKFLINRKGEGELYFPDPVFHMFDFTGNGAEEVITLSPGYLRIYSSGSRLMGKDKKQNLNYLKHKVVNHTHY